MPRKARRDADPKVSYFITFLRVVEEGGFRKAARKLGLSPVAVMNHVRALEDYFKVKLLKPKGGRLTPEGEEVYRVLKEVVGKLNLLKGLVPEVEEEYRFTLKVYTAETPMEYLLPCFLVRFREFNPGADFQIDVGSMEDVKKAVLERWADIGLVMAPSEFRDSFREFEMIRILNDRLVAVVSPLHRISKEEFVSLNTLIKYPLILDKPGSDNRMFVDELFKKNMIDYDSLKVKLVLRGSTVIMTAVSQGLGVSILPEMPTRKWVKAGLVKTIPLRCEEVTLSLLQLKAKNVWTDILKSFWSYTRWFVETYGENPPCVQRFTPI